MPVAQDATDLDHPRQCGAPVGKFGHPEADRQIAGQALPYSHSADVAQMARDRACEDRDHAKAMTEGQRRQDPAFGDTEDRPCRALARRKQAGIAEAGDHKGGSIAIMRADRPAQRQDDRVRIKLAFDARGPLL